ncbi:MAG: hypothetical protein R8K48_01500 [Gallionella sp.]
MLRIIMSEQDDYQVLPVVLSASLLSQSLSEAPNAMTLIDRTRIVASGFRSTPDFFKRMLGRYVSYYKGRQTIVFYHGSTDQYARCRQILIAGCRVYMTRVGTVDWADLPVTGTHRSDTWPIDRLSGCKFNTGCHRVMMCVAGAMDGKSVSFTHGNKGINDMTARFGRRGDQLDYRMTLAYTADHGYDNLTSSPNNRSIGQFKAAGLLNDSNQARLLNDRVDDHPNAIDRYDIQFGFNDNVQGVGFNDKNPSATNPFGTNANTFHNLVSNSGFMQWGGRQLAADGKLSVRYYHIRHGKHEAFPAYLSGVLYRNSLVQSLKMSRDQLEVQHTFNVEEK